MTLELPPIPDPKKAVIVPEVDLKVWEPYREPLAKGRHPHDPPGGTKVVGRPTPLVDARPKVSGQALYTDDLQMPNMLVAKLVRATRPHARILAIDASKALAIPGVVAIATGQDAPVPFGVLPITNDEHAMALEKVRFVGEPLAAVAAEDEWTALEAARAVEVEYEDLPVYLDHLKGVASVPVKIHPEMGIDDSNVQKHVDQHFGNVPAAAERSPVRVRNHWRFKGVTHAFTEPHAVVAHYDAKGRLNVWSATQVPHYLHRALAKVTGLPMHRIRVVRPQVGGGFGGKSDPLPHEFAAAVLSMKTGRPVKILYDRDESFYSGRHRHPGDTDFAISLDAEGRITSFDVQAVIDGGAFASFGIISTYYNGVLVMGPYKVPNFRYRGRRVYTNHVPAGAMRGHGAVNVRCALETTLDEAAERIGLDPFELRRRNLLPPYSLSINEFRMTSNGMPECLDKVERASRWSERWRKLPLGKGLGLGCGMYISGSNLPIHWDVKDYPQSTVHLKIDMDAGVTVHTGAAEIGQGSDTVAAQMVAEVLGVRLDRIRVKSDDTDNAPVDLGSYSSRVTFMMGNAARKAAEAMRVQLAKAATAKLGWPEELWRFEDEHVFSAAHPEVRLTFEEVVREALAKKGALQSSGCFNQTPLGGKFKGANAGLAPAYSLNAYVAEVDVDLDTGQWKCTKVWAAHDCGKALNPLAVEGQIEGSIHMGLGQVHGEALEWNRANLRNPNLLEYKIPTSLEMPEVETFIVESNDAEGPFGAKEAGEGPLIPILPAVVNALHDAIGVRFTQLPVTPDLVHAAMERQGGAKKPRHPKANGGNGA